MSSTLALVKSEQPQKEKESRLQYLDHVRQEAFLRLCNKEKLTEEEKKECQELESALRGHIALSSPEFSMTLADEDMKHSIERLHNELEDQFGSDTPQKKLLIHRLVSAWNQAWSYERMFAGMKYGYNQEKEGYVFYSNIERTKYLTEVRKGMESANDQIIRLTQALQNLTNPPIQVKAKNAIIAQNMQFNQGIPPTQSTHEKAHPGTL